jgi:hypothetical protein
MRTIAALYVETGGCYFGLPDVDPWDEARDARLYAGPHPVVAHPPCQRWGRYWAGSPLVINRTGRRLIKGDDNGCFAAALASVRQWGGILEHPEGSHAWRHFGLSHPPRDGGWVAADFEGGWTCCVEQGFYGHWARKPTWLYAKGVDLPPMKWGRGERRLDPEIVARIGYKRAVKWGEVSRRGGGGNGGDRARSATPTEFRELLLSIARSAIEPARMGVSSALQSTCETSRRGISDPLSSVPAGFVLSHEHTDSREAQDNHAV